MSNLEDTKAQIPSVFWTIANGVFLASGIALIVMRNDYLWGVPQITAGLFGLATMFLIKKTVVRTAIFYRIFTSCNSKWAYGNIRHNPRIWIRLCSADYWHNRASIYRP